MMRSLKRRLEALALTPRQPRLDRDAPLLYGSAEHKRLEAEGQLAGRVIISPDELGPENPIL
jgi:hypothetical protein